MNLTLQPGIIADDFTGAMDTGAQFARYGLTTQLGLAALPASPVVILNTASREIPPQEAQARCQAAAAQLSGRRLFKKIDSTLRGHIAAELTGLLSVFPAAKIVLCPAAPQQGRVVQAGRLYIHGQPLDQTAFRHDPIFPARTALLAERIGLPTTHLALETVRGPLDALAQAITSAPTSVVTLDAETEDDLLHIAQAAIHAEAIPCGAFGLANAWAQALTGRLPESKPFAFPAADAPVLVVAGSANARTHAQIKALRAHPESLVCPLLVPLTAAQEEQRLAQLGNEWTQHRAIVLCPGQTEPTQAAEWLTFAQTVARLAADLIRRQRPAGLVITGGETANALCAALGVQAVTLLGEAAPGIPVGRLVGGDADGLTLVTKAGGFGQDDCLEKLIF